jgi:hypothetical protein
LEIDMKTLLVALLLAAVSVPAHAAPGNRQIDGNSQSLEKRCRDMVGKEVTEGEGRSHMGMLQAQRFSDCMMGMPN